MTTKFSKQKLAEAQEKKAKGVLVSGILSKKRSKVGNVSKDDPVVTPPSTHSPAKHPASSPGESLFVSGKLLDLKKKVSIAKPMIKSLSAENEMLKNMVTILAVEAENDKECVAALEKSLQVEKDFYEYSDEFYGYYMEGFDLLRKWVVKHHPDLDLSGLVIGDVEKELLSDCTSEAVTENVMEKAITVAKVTEEATTVTPADPVLDEQ
nr:hypothetical protein CFP56_49198 [Quercus suber]